MKPRGVPVVMYHGVGPEKPGWVWNHLLVRADVFERQMKRLRDEGWTTIFLGDLHAHLEHNEPLPPKPVVLTFDDGYLDNWVYAAPILAKYGHRAVVYMSSDFVDPATEPRPTLDEAWAGRVAEADLPVCGFLSFAEMQLMEERGVMEVQSHAKTHTWYPCGPRIVDYHRPAGADGYRPKPWIGWNLRPDRKFAYMTERPEEEVPWGTPIFEHRKSLAGPRWLPDGSLADRLVSLVAAEGRENFFEQAGWRERLDEVAGEHGPRGRPETDDEYEERVRFELTESKRVLEEGLGKRVDFLCWPGGGRNPRVLELAAGAGYRATTTHYDDPSRRNLYGQKPSETNRTGCGAPWQWRGIRVEDTAPGFFTAILDRFNGVPGALWRMRLHKLWFVMRHLFRHIAGRNATRTTTGT